MKVALIMGIAGFYRCDELTRLNIENNRDKVSYLLDVLPFPIPDVVFSVKRSRPLYRTLFEKALCYYLMQRLT